MTTANDVGSVSLDFNKTLGTQSLSFGYMGVLTQLFGGRIAPVTFNFSSNQTAGFDAAGNLVSGTGDAFASFMAGAGNGGSAGFNALDRKSTRLNSSHLG